MKKMIFITVAAFALLAGCAKNEDKGGNPASPDVINFALSTAGSPSTLSTAGSVSTRAAIVDLAGLQSATGGFVVYGIGAANPSDWYNTGGPINGTNNYRYTGTIWDWATTARPTWPTNAAGYPVNFYAYYSSATGSTGVGTVTATPAPLTITAPFVVPDVVTDQVDFLVTDATANSKPTGGKLSMTFEHALSKIDFGVIAGVNTISLIQSVAVHNVGFQRTFDFIAVNWTAAQPSTFNKSYTYYGKVTDGANGSGVIAVRYIAGIDGTTAVPVLTATSRPQVASTGHLMLMPQTAATWQPAPNVPAANAYIGLIYRMETVDNSNAVGFQNSPDHPNYSGSALASKGYEGPLFVKVGYPFSTPSPFTWEKSKGYTYNIYLGTPNASNGFLIDNRYYDDEGNRTDLPVMEPDLKNPGEPINPADNIIHFYVDVEDWVDTPVILQ